VTARGHRDPRLAALNGARYIPLHSIVGGRCTCGEEECASPGKHPLWSGWQSKATADTNLVALWNGSNVGLVTGKASNLVVVDIDPRHDGHHSLARFEADHEQLPRTFTVRTGGGGVHLYFRHPGSQVSNKSNLFPGVDVRGDGGFVVAPGSTHQSGGTYEIECDAPPADLPPALLELLCPAPPPPRHERPYKSAGAPGVDRYCEAALQAEVAAVASEPQGGRNHRLNRAAFSLGQLIGGGVLQRDSVQDELLHAAVRAGLPEHEARTTIRSGIESGLKDPRGVPTSAARQSHAMSNGQFARSCEAGSGPEVGVNPTDLGNAERLVAHHGVGIRYVHAWGSWVIWDGQRWTRDRSGEVTRLAIETVRNIYAETAQLEDAAERKARAKHAMASEAAGRIRAMIELAQADARVAVLPEVFDSEATRYLFNVENGTIDVRTGELRPHRPEDYITKLAGCRFDPWATADLWQGFLKRVLPDDDVRAFLQRFVGSALTGDTADRRALLDYGTGKNGKSTLLGVLLALFGDYGYAIPFDLLLEAVGRKDRRGSPRSDLMALAGVRLATAVEAPAGQRLDETLLKSMTGGGGDRITGRRLYEREDWSFVPECKLLLACNHRPEIRTGGEAVWDRICEIPFLVRIPAEEQDPTLLGRLSEQDELAGILAWGFEGARDWWSVRTGDRLRPPDAVLRATQAYRASQDPLGPFLEERCLLEPDAQVATAALWEAFKVWCAGEKPPISRRKFADLLVEEHGCQGKDYSGRRLRIGHKNESGLRGIRLRDVFDEESLS
jgi:putative DNA primase/helicase